MVRLVSSRYTYATFVFRFAENGGRRIEKDIIVELVHVPAPPKEEEGFKRDPRMERLNADDWKQQDHYMVMGIEHLRPNVTAEDLRQAYRARVLLYHPDKIAQRLGTGKGKRQKDDAIFKCIQKAHMILGDADKKEAFDHVDPTFDNGIPEEKLPASADFYSTYGPVFDRNIKFSKRPSKVALGHEGSPREDVEAFYQFWFDFDSIRRFDYLDEEECETGGRADKRFMEKKNKAARTKRKADDNLRLRTLVDNAYKLDPRIKLFKEADKQAKLDRKAKQASGGARPAAGTADAAKKAEEARVKAEADKAAAAAAEDAAKDAKKVKEAEANALRKERKALKSLFAEHNYFIPAGLLPAAKLKQLEEEAALVEQVCSKLGRLEIQATREDVERLVGGGAAQVTNVLRTRLGLVNKEVVEQARPAAAEAKPQAQAQEAAADRQWTLHETDLLINGTKKFPGGTRNRWETIADWLNRQMPDVEARSVDELLRKSNAINAAAVGGMATPLESEAAWASTAKRDPRIDQNEPSLAAGVLPDGPISLAWTADEQAALEKAIKSIPMDDPQRWDAISAAVGSRTKKECMLRAKELATLLKQQQKA